jgi:UDP-N-acetylmuramyl pentapeptide phosphotransferase/UDP-N-acetylglucosamine-1-phosphate transferase
VPITPIKKFIIQLLAAVILVYKAQVSLDNWWGILGVHQIDEPLAFIFSILTIVGIINAYNLIDGINGLAASMALMASLLFGGWFFLAGYVEWSVVAMALAGSIVAFLHYNVTPAKIFMGDTGSMLIGALCAVMAIEFIHLNMEIGPSSRWYMSGAPVVAMSILIFPVYDTLRVFYLRMKMGKSPFHADKNHLHHLLLQGGKTHMQATAILVGANLLMVALALGLQPWGLNWSLLLLAAAALALNFILTGWLAQQKKRAARK